MITEDINDRNDMRRPFRERSGKSRMYTGIILLAAGVILLVQRISEPFPAWLFSWPVILIILGLFFGIRKGFRGPGWLMFIVVGAVFLISDLKPELHIQRYWGPILIIAAGIAFIFRPRKNSFGERWMMWDDCTRSHEKKNPGTGGEAKDGSSPPNEELLDVVSILGGTKKIIFSKDFKGGDVTSFLGGTELNLSQADIKGRVRLDLTQIFGGTKLIVPPNWDIQPELVSIFGGIEDKRNLSGNIDPAKVLVLKGTSVFGGIEIRSF